MITTYFMNKIQDDIFLADYAKPTTYYLGVSSTAPTVAGTNFTEPVGKGYARVPLTRGSDFIASVNGVTKNKNNEEFPLSTEDWANMTHWGIFDSITGGNLLIANTLTKQRNIQSEMKLYIDANGLTFTLSN